MSRLIVSDHAAERYVERVKPLLDRVEARAEIERLLPMSREIEFPDWCKSRRNHDERAFELTEGIVAVERDGSIVTIVIRGGMDERRRAERNERKRKQRIRRYDKKRGLGPRPVPEWSPNE